MDKPVPPACMVDLGLVDYARCHQLQQRLAEGRYRESLQRDLFLIVEHTPVFTLGRRGGRQNLMVSDQFLANKGVPVVPIERGGDITYHGPGQLVIYPIIKLRQAGLSVTELVWSLEELMRELAGMAGVKAVRDPRNHGIWVDGKKLGSIGIAIRHGVSFHGMALNISLDMEPFGWVNPCGLTGVAMTSLNRETGVAQEMTGIKKNLDAVLGRIFHRQILVGTEECGDVWML